MFYLIFVALGLLQERQADKEQPQGDEEQVEHRFGTDSLFLARVGTPSGRSYPWVLREVHYRHAILNTESDLTRHADVSVLAAAGTLNPEDQHVPFLLNQTSHRFIREVPDKRQLLHRIT